ncbi:Zinc finger, C2H2 [Artemisia annua]|uniref:Zinc finger, C2H2 n=1 Tax=Artemisia annua TaxID=35608 RepID=A0A2U1KVZ7_ARTAN|nr:Zinc finger, C2H2 [Artemisia annua]
MIMEEIAHHMIKGKRTKRRRPSSALTLTLAGPSTSSSTTTSETGVSTNQSSGFFQTHNIEFINMLQDNHTNNDQDIAKCLMLLANGDQPLSPQPLNMAMPSRSYAYECKTCDRGFTSFQALGGHRASHNKPQKGVLEYSKDRTSLLIRPKKPLPCNPNGSTKGSKVHECSICGADFTSGQALGGHMRRHRPITSTTTITNSTASTSNTSYGCHESKKHKTLLPLDLNLPARVEDDHIETKIPYEFINNQIIVFSSTRPSFVNCHF